MNTRINKSAFHAYMVETKMEKIQLKLLKPWKDNRAGDVVSVPAGVLPERMIRDKTAKRYIPKKIKRGDK